MPLTRKDLAIITEMVMTEIEPVEKEFKNYTLYAEPIIEENYWEDKMVGYTVRWKYPQD